MCCLHLNLPAVYPIVDGPLLAARGLRMSIAAEALLEAGMSILQFRWKDGVSREVYEEAKLIQQLCAESDAMFIVNDRIDVAMLLTAGAHIGQEDLPVPEVRHLLGASPVLGLSTHNEAQFRAAVEQPVDYLALGPIFGTVSKLNPDPVVGTAEFQRLARASVKPVVAIGGITRINVAEVWAAGAASAAIIGDLYPPQATKASVRARAEEWVKLAHEHRG